MPDQPTNSAEAMFWTDSDRAPVPHEEPEPQYELPPPSEPATRMSGGALIVLGLLAIALGSIVTCGSHQAAVDAGGGRYVVFYGPIAAGIVAVFRGLLRL